MSKRAFGTISRLPSGRYRATYTGPDRRRHSGWTTYRNRGEAERWLRDEEELSQTPRWTPPATRNPHRAADPMTVREYATANVKRRATRARRPIRPTTVDLYNKLLDLAILPHLGDVALVDLTPLMIQRWHDALPTSTPTQNGNAYLLLRSLLIDAVEDDLITTNPCKIRGAGKPAPKRPGEALTASELVAYTSAAQRRAVPLLLTAWCALRSSEVRGLRRGDIAPDATVLRVEQIVTRVGRGKGRRQWRIGPPKTTAGVRRIAIPPHLRPMVLAWMERHRTGPDGLLFPGDDGGPMGEQALRTAHKEAAVRIGRPDLTLHDLRRTGATLAAQSGATMREVMSMLGHTTLDMAIHYQVADEQRDAARAERMSALTGWAPLAIEADIVDAEVVG